jgi:serine/threonine protein kinase
MMPTKIGRYEIKAELGRGGMATVYRAYDPGFDREVAIKVLPKEFLHDPNFHDRFKREIKIIAALEHPAIVPVYDVGEDDGVPYFVMRYMTGGSLTNQIERGIFSLQDAARIVEKLASALAYAHKKGVVHRDLKPDNILFDSNGDPYISDFGVASFSSGTTDLTGNAAIGTPAYMSPEQAQGDKVDGRSDIYGLGAIIFQMLSGQQPYKADTPMGVAVKQITDPVPEILKVNPTLPRETDTIIKTAMAKKREDRYPSTTELAKAFQQVAESRQTVASGKESVAPQSVATKQGSPRTASSPVATQPASSSSASSGKSRGLVFAGIAIIGILVILAVVVLGAFFLKDKLFSSQPAETKTVIAEAAATDVIETTPPEANSNSFTEDFNGSLDNWDHFVAGGDESQLTSSVENGFLNFEIKGKGLYYYIYHTPKTYGNVRIDVRAENRGEINSTVIIICRYNEDNGWYEFDINNGGLYKIVYTKWNADKQNTSSAIIANGGSTLIHTGKEVNEYSATCSDRTLSLSINGTEVRSETDNNFVLGDGYAGAGVASEKFIPVKVGLDSVSISQP